MKKLLLLSALLLCSGQAAKADVFVGSNYGHWGWGPGVIVTYPPLYYGYSYYPWYPARLPTYGAISYSMNTDEIGFGWGYNTLADATRAANNGCGVSDCGPVVWVQSGCAAVATSKTGRSLGWAYENTKSAAKTLAMRACRRSGGTDCIPRAWVCSF